MPSCSPTPQRALALLLLSLLMATSCQKSTESTPTSVTWTSTTAPYRVTLPPGWQPFNPEIFQNGADYAANFDDRVFMVLATPIPPRPGTDTPPEPDLDQFVKTATEQLEKDVVNLEVRSTQRALLDDTLQSVILRADGVVNQHPSRYMIAYTTMPGWYIQLVAWSHPTHSDLLATEFDFLLEHFEAITAPRALPPPSQDMS